MKYYCIMVFWCINVKVAYRRCWSRSQLTPGRRRGAPWMSLLCSQPWENGQNISADISVKPQDVWLTITWRFVSHLFGQGERWQPSAGSSVGGTKNVLPSKCYLGKSTGILFLEIYAKSSWNPSSRPVQTWFGALLKGYSLNLFS